MGSTWFIQFNDYHVYFRLRSRKTITSRITLGMSIYSLKCFEETAQITTLSEFSYFTIIKFRIFFFLYVSWLNDTYDIAIGRRLENCPVICNNKGPDQPAHSRSFISNFVVSFLRRIIPRLAWCEKINFLSSLFSQRDWFETSFVGNPEDRFSRASWPVLLA